MGVYVDPVDLKQHFRQGAGVDESTIEEIMREQETYVQGRLRLDALPPNHDVLKSVIRDLTISKCIYQLTSINVDQLSKADQLERSALRRLRELEDEGSLKPRDKTNVSREVYSPYPKFFTPGDFGFG